MTALRFAFAGLFFVAGCSSGSKSPQTPEQLQGRLDAANRITSISQRNDAMKAIAEDAADSDAGDVALMALEAISTLSVRNDVAERCALKFLKRGNTKAATAVAETITSMSKKNEVLAQIAKGN